MCWTQTADTDDLPASGFLSEAQFLQASQNTVHWINLYVQIYHKILAMEKFLVIAIRLSTCIL